MDTTTIENISSWVKMQEAFVLANGIPLTFSQTADAYAIGIEKPEDIRVMYVRMGDIPICPYIDETHLGVGYGNSVPGMCVNRGIFVTSKSRFLLCHELRHVYQYELAGSIQRFIHRYVNQCMMYGYTNAPYELDANRVADMISNDFDRDLPMAGCLEWF